MIRSDHDERAAEWERNRLIYAEWKQRQAQEAQAQVPGFFSLCFGMMLLGIPVGLFFWVVSLFF